VRICFPLVSCKETGTKPGTLPLKTGANLAKFSSVDNFSTIELIKVSLFSKL
jgi:hypothetical protein